MITNLSSEAIHIDPRNSWSRWAPLKYSRFCDSPDSADACQYNALTLFIWTSACPSSERDSRRYKSLAVRHHLSRIVNASLTTPVPHKLPRRCCLNHCSSSLLSSSRHLPPLSGSTLIKYRLRVRTSRRRCAKIVKHLPSSTLTHATTNAGGTCPPASEHAIAAAGLVSMRSFGTSVIERT
ncbi:hypothetical protein BDV98DRAFT_561922 [Pterulicium gracile]|uniref:Uncharacterized protein n=1 Tax=Pterulicium gracile TaxID=1884261 RepID=A0A5C3QX64_9AGAR|nr:hypothetical protein BDV98DRAFT_561922 [Pterula gracilis]